jgi:hypothetical protein
MIETSGSFLLIISLIAAATIVISVLLWQVFATLRAQITSGSAVDADQIRRIAEQVNVIRRQQGTPKLEQHDTAACRASVEETR